MAILSKIGGFSGSGSEVSAYDPASKRLFVVAGTDETAGPRPLLVLDLSNPATPTLVQTIPVSTFGGAANSIAVRDGLVAVAIEGNPKTSPGSVVFLDANGALLKQVIVGALPDMITFSPDGKRVLTANEGEPNSYGRADSVDPVGSVSIIDISGGVANATVRTAGFESFNSQIADLRAKGVRIFGPNATVAQDLEPEYITVAPDNKTAYVTLQENDALAVIDLDTATVSQIVPLGLKDFSAGSANGLDASDRDGGINIKNQPVFGLYQPDAIANFTANGRTYLITANEGDARDYAGFAEEVRVGASGYRLDPTRFPNGSTLKNNANLGRLTVSNATGDTDGDGDFDRIEMFGARSFSIWDTAGNLVFDSGEQLERVTADRVPALFNSNGDSGTFDTRSDNKGPEPEGVAIAVVDGRTFAFVGLERTGGVMVYEITNPLAPVFLQYLSTSGDVGPEVLTLIPATQSPTGKTLLISANEISATTAVYEFTPPTRRDGTAGNDNLFGTSQSDAFFGGLGDDNLYGNGGDDLFFGGAGNDNLYGGSGNDELDGGEGSDRLYGNGGNDQFFAGAGDDQLYGGSGQDFFNAGESNDLIYGNGGHDVVYAGSGNDIVYVGSGNDQVFAGAGDDLIYGNGGQDWLVGEAGNDVIYSGSGSDRLDGGLGNDTLWLNGGADVVVLRQGDGLDVINGFQFGQTTFALAGGLSFGSLSFVQGNGLTEIRAGGTAIAQVQWVQASLLNNSANFSAV